MAERRSRDAPSDISDAELLTGMRRGDPAALRELHRRFAPMLRRRAASWRDSGGAHEDLVEEVLEDVALTLMRPAAPTPRSLAAYLLTALRHRIARERSVRARRDHDERDAASPEHPYARPTRSTTGAVVATTS